MFEWDEMHSLRQGIDEKISVLLQVESICRKHYIIYSFIWIVIVKVWFHAVYQTHCRWQKWITACMVCHCWIHWVLMNSRWLSNTRRCRQITKLLNYRINDVFTLQTEWLHNCYRVYKVKQSTRLIGDINSIAKVNVVCNSREGKQIMWIWIVFI